MTHIANEHPHRCSEGAAAIYRTKAREHSSISHRLQDNHPPTLFAVASVNREWQSKSQIAE